jgi:hypothetical protein
MKRYTNSRTIRREIIEGLGIDPATIRVAWGRGTARDWLHVDLRVSSATEADEQEYRIEEFIGMNARRWDVGSHESGVWPGGNRPNVLVNSRHCDTGRLILPGDHE